MRTNINATGDRRPQIQKYIFRKRSRYGYPDICHIAYAVCHKSYAHAREGKISGGRSQSAHGIPESPDGEDPGRRLADKRANGLPEYQSLRFETGETTVF